MSVTTSQRINFDKFAGQFPGSFPFTLEGSALESNGSKTITVPGVTDAVLQTRVDAAAAQFVDYDSNRDDLVAKASSALTANAAFLALPSPTNPQTLAQVQTLTKECSALIRLLLGKLDTTTGT